jgi:hypothetical protein
MDTNHFRDRNLYNSNLPLKDRNYPMQKESVTNEDMNRDG